MEVFASVIIKWFGVKERIFAGKGTFYQYYPTLYRGKGNTYEAPEGSSIEDLILLIGREYGVRLPRQL